MDQIIRTWSIVTIVITALLLPSFSFAATSPCLQPVSMSAHHNMPTHSMSKQISSNCHQEVQSVDKAQDKNQLEHRVANHQGQLNDCCSASCVPSYTATHHTISTYIAAVYHLDISFFNPLYTFQYQPSLYRPPIA